MGKKLLMLLGAFLVIYLLNFSIPRLMPGDPFDYTSGAAGDDVDAAYSEAAGLLRPGQALFSTVEGYHCGQPPRGLRPEYPL